MGKNTKHTFNSFFVCFCFFFPQLDFWTDVTDVAYPVDIRVPFDSLMVLKAHLMSQDIDYTIMIDDLQVQRGNWTGVNNQWWGLHLQQRLCVCRAGDAGRGAAGNGVRSSPRSAKKHRHL